MYCSKCGEKNEKENIFCEECGAMMEQDSYILEKEKKVAKTEPEKGPSLKVIAIIVAIVFCLGVFYMVSNVHTCDICGKTFFGKAYWDSFDYDSTMCKPCALEYYYPPFTNIDAFVK